MIRFTDLVNGIQSAITGAVRGVEGQQLEALFDFFHTGSEEQERESGTRYENQEPRYENVGVARNGGGDTRFLSPKLVEMRFARETADGPQSHSVFVPLISLVPMNELQIESLELEMDVELVNHEDEMLVNFPQSRRNFLNRENAAQATKANAKIKLHVTAGPRPPGVDIVMQGYERALKAQIP
ncbi:DUF2589 domain-containing protein [Citromicrobium bathyomarinum]|uniref:DUF2589 domain-containing protein n=1 Tax=Citromicrobium bathyomarinum TaxID=72174 RepID=UPI00315AD6A1